MGCIEGLILGSSAMCTNLGLVTAGVISALAALLHIGCIVEGAPWYRFFGAGEKMATMAEDGKWLPHVLTAGISLVLLVWAGYAFSAAGFFFELPLLKPALILITAIYLVRGIGGFWFVFYPTLEHSAGFAFWSSLICTIAGLAHLLGLLEIWPDM